MSSTHHIITLDVGGELFPVSAGLMRKNAVLRTFLNSTASNPFIDSNPEYFQIILDRIRGIGSRPYESRVDAGMLGWEMARFGIDVPSPKSPPSVEGGVDINVGGTMFRVGEHIVRMIKREPYWYYYEMYFDRNPELFPLILGWLRGASRTSVCSAAASKSRMSAEAAFYGLDLSCSTSRHDVIDFLPFLCFIIPLTIAYMVRIYKGFLESERFAIAAGSDDC